MGMYSYFSNEEIKVLDKKSLDETIKTLKGCYIKQKWICEILAKMWDGNELTFSDWDDIKLISYWYDEQLVIFQCIAPYIQGEVYWTFENEDEAGWVEFNGGKCVLHIGQMEYKDFRTGDIIRDKKEIPEQLKKLMILGNL